MSKPPFSSVTSAYACACGRVYAAKAAEAAGDTRKKMRRLAQELRALQGAQGLPLQAAAAILLRHDGDRPDKMRALITGAAAFAFMTLRAWPPKVDKPTRYIPAE